MKTTMLSVKYFSCLLLLLVLGACSSRSQGRYAVLPYSAFGPQSLCYEDLGLEHYSWELSTDVGSSKDQGREGIRIIVYDGTSEEVASRMFVSSEKLEVDYRFLEVKKAIAILDLYLQEVKDHPVDIVKLNLEASKDWLNTWSDGAGGVIVIYSGAVPALSHNAGNQPNHSKPGDEPIQIPEP